MFGLFGPKATKEGLFEAVEANDVTSIRAILKKDPQLADKPNEKKETALQIACRKGNLEVARALVECGADPNKKDESGWAPLHITAAWDHIELTEMLLRKSANIDILTREGETPLHIAVFKGNRVVVKILCQYGADINARRKDLSTPMHIAVQKNDINIARLLMVKGVNINAKDNDGRTPMALAYHMNLHQMVEFLGYTKNTMKEPFITEATPPAPAPPKARRVIPRPSSSKMRSAAPTGRLPSAPTTILPSLPQDKITPDRRKTEPPGSIITPSRMPQRQRPKITPTPVRPPTPPITPLTPVSPPIMEEPLIEEPVLMDAQFDPGLMEEPVIDGMDLPGDMMEEPVIDGMDLPGDMMEEPVIDGMDLPGDMMEEPVIDGMDLPGDMMEESVHEIIETMPLESPEISQDVADWIHGGITQETDTDWDEEIPLGQEDSWFTEDLSSGESLDDGDEEISDKWQEYTGLGHEFLEKGDLDKALSNFNIAMEYNPRSAERYADRAMAYIRLDKTAEALSDLNRAIELDPQEAGYYLSRAKIHHQMQNLHWALQDCEMVSELSPFSQLAQEAQDLAGELSGS